MPRIAQLATFTVLVAATSAVADPMTGSVTSQRSWFTDDGRAIVTESILTTANGDVAVRQVGGSANGIGMVIIHAPRILTVGERVTVTVDASRWLVHASPGQYIVQRKPEFAQTRTQGGVPLHWKQTRVPLTYDERGTSHIDGEFGIMDAAVAEWTTHTEICAFLTVVPTGVGNAEIGFDHVNTVLFREDRWCRPATATTPERCHPPNAAGQTTLFFIDVPGHPDEGRIVDADIEFNGVDFAISADGNTTSQSSCLSDLANVFTHELGHLYGLDHTCTLGQTPRPIDDSGLPVPSCTSPILPAGLADTTMFPSQECGEVKKATIEPDDIRGVCAIYDPATVAEGGFCSTTGHRLPRGWVLVVLTVLIVGRPRRRTPGH